MSETDSRPLLDTRGITRTFPGVRALHAVDFILNSGEIHGLVGENGAGKTTLINILSGVFPPDAGSVMLNNRTIAPRSPFHAQQLGISTVHQDIDLIPDLSIAENMFLGRLPRRGLFLDWNTVRSAARDALLRLHIHVDVSRPLRSCSTAIQQMIAIARAVDQDAKVLILDEPTSSLDQSEVDELFAIMRRLKTNGIGIIFISHFLDQVEHICDAITVLRNGERIGTYRSGELTRHELITRMIGKTFAEAPDAPLRPNRGSRIRSAPAPVVLEAEAIGRPGFLNPMSLIIRKGESLGLAGLLGSGRSELAHLIFGARRAATGSISFCDRNICDRRKPFRNPRAAIRNRIALVPEDRKTQGILPDLSIMDNMVIALQARCGFLRPLRRKQRRQLVQQFIKRLGITTPDTIRPIRQLSGGNQQKVLLARWLAMNPALLILDEPTRGIDIGTKAEVQAIARNLCATGTAILFISSELDEVVRDTDRVIVMRNREKIGELVGEDISLNRIINLMAGHTEADSRHA